MSEADVSEADVSKAGENKSAANHTRKGSCLCGNIKFTVTLEALKTGICNCNSCRKWSAGPIMVSKCASDVELSGEENLKWYKSSDFAERAFCSSCGSSLFYRLNEAYEDLMVVSTACLEGEDDFELSHQLFVESKPPYYEFKTDCPHISAADFKAMVSSMKVEQA